MSAPEDRDLDLDEMFLLSIRCDLCGVRYEERDEYACGEPDYQRDHRYEAPHGEQVEALMASLDAAKSADGRPCSCGIGRVGVQDEFGIDHKAYPADCEPGKP